MPFASAPPTSTLARMVSPAKRSRTNTSVSPFPSPATRSDAGEANADEASVPAQSGRVERVACAVVRVPTVEIHVCPNRDSCLDVPHEHVKPLRRVVVGDEVPCVGEEGNMSAVGADGRRIAVSPWIPSPPGHADLLRADRREGGVSVGEGKT